MGQPYDKYVLAVSLSVFALQGFAPRANSVFRIRENLRAKGGSSPLELESVFFMLMQSNGSIGNQRRGESRNAGPLNAAVWAARVR